MSRFAFLAVVSVIKDPDDYDGANDRMDEIVAEFNATHQDVRIEQLPEGAEQFDA